MARSGFLKWEKYFSNEPVNTKTKNIPNIPLYNLDGKNLPESFLKPETEIEVLPEEEYNSKQKIKYMNKEYRVSISKIQKPLYESQSFDKLRLFSVKFLRGAKEKKFEWNNKIFSAFYFAEKDELTDIIKTNLYKIPEIQHQIPETIKIIDRFLEEEILDWSDLPEKKLYAKNEFAKYLGEILVGWYVLDNNKDVFVGSHKDDLFYPDTEIEYFIIPNDFKFSTIDSMISYYNGVTIPISSKSGSGAKASIFTGIIEQILSDDIELNPKKTPILYALKKHIIDEGGTKKIKRKGRKVIYRYLINNILKLDFKNINPEDVLRQSVKYKQTGKLGKKLKFVISHMKKHDWDNPQIKRHLKHLPDTITGIICREIAFDLNNSEEEKDMALSILGMKDFYQVNLNLLKWKRGQVEFKVIHSGQSQIRFVGDKSAISDVTAKQGTVNYRIY